jgi:hypothetical protein
MNRLLGECVDFLSSQLLVMLSFDNFNDPRTLTDSKEMIGQDIRGRTGNYFISYLSKRGAASRVKPSLLTLNGKEAGSLGDDDRRMNWSHIEKSIMKPRKAREIQYQPQGAHECHPRFTNKPARSLKLP